jgi:aromatic amino acid aminotransferase I
MDTDGRVIRFDTVSKFMAPGVRFGWITSTPQFITKYIFLQEATSQVYRVQKMTYRIIHFFFLFL